MSGVATASSRPTSGPPVSSRIAAAAIGAVAIATVGSALATQYVGGLVPCKLCLWQRWPYYVAIPLAAATASAPAGLRRIGLAMLALVFVASTGLGTYHAGAEWGWWPGPSDCGGGTGVAPSSVGGLLGSLETIKVVSCTDAAWRWLGLSLAGWNAAVSLGLAVFAGWAASRPR